jgi:hypothetical protein
MIVLDTNVVSEPARLAGEPEGLVSAEIERYNSAGGFWGNINYRSEKFPLMEPMGFRANDRL